MPFKLTAADEKILDLVHPDLQRVVRRAAEISPIPFRVVEGMRTLARQRQLKAQGMSKTLNSRHLTGHAVDLVPIVDLDGDGRLHINEMYNHAKLAEMAPFIKRAFREERVPFNWGGDWRNAWDKPHWQLPWSKYPIQTASLHSDRELEAAWLEVQEDGRMETPAITPGTARASLEGASLLGGAGLVMDAAADLQKAETHLSAGTVIGFVIGGLVVLGVAMSLYDRWDAAGRPLPRFLRRALG